MPHLFPNFFSFVVLSLLLISPPSLSAGVTRAGPSASTPPVAQMVNGTIGGPPAISHLPCRTLPALLLTLVSLCLHLPVPMRGISISCCTIAPSLAVSLLQVGDSVNLKEEAEMPYRLIGIPDGLGAYVNDEDGKSTVHRFSLLS